MLFSELAATYGKIEGAENLDDRRSILKELCKGLHEHSLETVAHLTVGELVDPVYSSRLRIGPGLIRKTVAELSGSSEQSIRKKVRDAGDLSQVVEDSVDGAEDLSVRDLWIRMSRTVKRDEDRGGLVRYIFEHTKPIGAKYFTRMALDQMRIGVGHSALIDTLADAYDVRSEDIQRVYALTNDIGLAAVRARRGVSSLSRTSLSLMRPYRFMNARRAEDLEEVLDRFGDTNGLYETKYDGARLQIHIKKGRSSGIRMFSRSLDDVTDSLPDMVESLQNCWTGEDAIVEGEAVAYDTSLTQKQPFQAVLSRLGRKHDIEQTARQKPLVLFLFDVLYDSGHNLMSLPQRDRRQRLRGLFRSTRRVRLTKGSVMSDASGIRDRFDKAVKDGHEGLIAKEPDAHYTPGKRVHSWMKLKPEYETLDVVVTGAIWGSGRRQGLLSSFVIAVRDGDDLLNCGRVGAGFSDEQLESLTERLMEQATSTRGRRVDLAPDLVIEVDFQDIQKTSAYDAGYTLRIPRFKRERVDRSPEDADTAGRLETLYEKLH